MKIEEMKLFSEFTYHKVCLWTLYYVMNTFNIGLYTCVHFLNTNIYERLPNEQIEHF